MLLSLAENAFDNSGGPEIERQLNDIFVDGLVDEILKLKVLRDIPNNLQRATTIVRRAKFQEKGWDDNFIFSNRKSTRTHGSRPCT